MQIYPKTNTAYCFSSNCKTHGKSMDVIDFIMNKENISKHEAILRAGTLLGASPKPERKTLPVKQRSTEQSIVKKEKEITPVNAEFLERIFTYFRNGIHSSRPALDYLSSRALDAKQTEIGFNSGQFHHGERRSEELLNNSLSVGLLIDKNLKGKTGEKAFSVFGNKCLVFPLRDCENRIVSLYFRSTVNNDTQKHYYLKTRQGLYPGYPDGQTKV
jgi:DNA primase